MLAWYLKLSKDAQSVPSDFALNRQLYWKLKSFWVWNLSGAFWNRLSEDTVESLSFEVFHTWLDKALKFSQLWEWGWTGLPSKWVLNASVADVRVELKHCVLLGNIGGRSAHTGTWGTAGTCCQVHYTCAWTLYWRGLSTASFLVFIYILYLYTFKCLCVFTPQLCVFVLPFSVPLSCVCCESLSPWMPR